MSLYGSGFQKQIVWNIKTGRYVELSKISECQNRNRKSFSTKSYISLKNMSVILFFEPGNPINLKMICHILLF